MKIALFQSDIDWCNKKENLRVAELKIREAKKSDCSVIFFPEMSFTGFSMNIELTKESKGETISLMKRLAVENKIAIGFGYVKDLGDVCENHYGVVDKEGNLISDFAKIHPFSAGYEDKSFVGGNELTRYTIDGMSFSTLVCYDLRFPEVFLAVSEDTDIIVVPANWPKCRSEQWKTMLKSRAIENQCYILGVNCVGVHDELYYSGDSMAVNPEGQVIKMTSNIQDLMIVDINNDVYEYREKLNVRRDRKQWLYRGFYD